MKYFEFRCPNRKYSEKDTPCNGQLGGFLISLLKGYNFKKPFVDIRYCPHCRTFIRITIETFNGPMKYEVLKNERIDFKRPETLFNTINVDGRRVKK